MSRSKISWTDTTWEIVSGCTKVSAGCQNCFAERMFPRIHHADEELDGMTSESAPTLKTRPRKFSDVRLHPERLYQPLHWRKPRKVFVCSRADLFHEDVPDEFLMRVFCVMAAAPKHTFQVLTKRPERMRDFCKSKPWFGRRARFGIGNRVLADVTISRGILPNVWLGVSVEDQQRADERLDLLRQTPAAVHFVSLEPLLERVDLSNWTGGWLEGRDSGYDADGSYVEGPLQREFRPAPWQLDWVIVGGESGPKARPMGIDWVRSIRDHCAAAMVPLFVKQDSGPCAGRQGNLPDDLWAMKEFPS